MNKLLGKNLVLRAQEPEDLEILYQWENDTSIWRISSRMMPLSKYQMKRYLENAHKDIYEIKQVRLMIEVVEGSRPVGTIDLFDFDPYHRRGGVGILISAPEDRRKGYAAEALDLMIRYAFETIDLHLLHCSIYSDNAASLELFKQAGFKITGTKVQWTWDGEKFMDEHFLQLLR